MPEKKRINTVNFHIGDWETATMGWDAVEVGAYHSIIMALYANEGEIVATDARLMRIARVRDSRTWKRIAPLILDKLEVDGQRYTHRRVTEEIQIMRAKSVLAKASADARHRKKPNKNKGGNVRSHSGGNANHLPLTTYDINIITGFDDWFGKYPLSTHTSRPAAEAAWVALTDDERDHAVAVVGLWARMQKATEPHMICGGQKWLGEQRFKNIAKPKARAAISAPPVGTDARKLYDGAKATGMPVSTWSHWLTDEKVTVVEGVVYARNGFTRDKLSAGVEFEKVFIHAGFRLAAHGERAPAQSSEDV